MIYRTYVKKRKNYNKGISEKVDLYIPYNPCIEVKHCQLFYSDTFCLTNRFILGNSDSVSEKMYLKCCIV